MGLISSVLGAIGDVSKKYGSTSGPQGAAGKALENLDYGSANYVRHQTFPGGFLVETDKQFSQWVLVDRNHQILDRRSGANTSYDTAASWAQSSLPTEGWTGYGDNTAEVAPDIDYSDFSQFIDESGDISDKQGMVDYLSEMPGMEGKTPATIMGLLSSMPNLAIGQGELGQAKSKYQSDVYGLQSQLKGARQKEQSMAGMTGIYSPTAKGFGSEDFTKGLYSQLEGVQAGAQDQYGLGEEKEQDLATWIASMSGLA